MPNLVSLLKLALFLLGIQFISGCQMPLKKGNQPLGLIFDDNRYAAIPLKATLTRGSYEQLPVSADLSTYCPAIERQEYSTCVGWATAYYARTISYAREHGISSASEVSKHAFSPGFTYRATNNSLNIRDNSCSNGSYIDVALQIMKDFGALPYGEFPYECEDITPEVASRAAAFKKLFELNSSGQPANTGPDDKSCGRVS